LDIPTLVGCIKVDTRMELAEHVLEMHFETEDVTQVYVVEVKIDPRLVLDGKEAVRTLFSKQREALPEASRAAWDEAVAKIEVLA
jgi:hypothetical protein